MIKRTYKRIFIHCTAANYYTVNPQFFAVNRWHKNRFGYYYNEETKEQVAPSSLGYYGGYHILIEKDGSEWRYREDWEESMAVFGHNRSSLSVTWAFDGDIQLPTQAQQDTMKKRVLKWCEKYNIPTDKVYYVGPHRQVNKGKTCYGSLLADDFMINLLKPVEKDKEDIAKKENTEGEKKVLIDTLQKLVLKLKILLGQYISALNKRSK